MSLFLSARDALRTLARKRLTAAWLFPFLKQRLLSRDPFAEAMRSFDARIAYARRHHQPVRTIERERQAFTHGALRG